MGSKEKIHFYHFHVEKHAGMLDRMSSHKSRDEFFVQASIFAGVLG
jgi:hypothetical protein